MKRAWVVLALVILVLAVTGCSKIQVDLPDREVPVSEEAAQSLQQKISQLDWQSGTATLTVTESEVTSYINLKLLDEEVPIKEPTVWFEDGKVYIAGKLDKNALPVGGQAALIVDLSVQDGKLHIQVEKAVVGGVPVPSGVLDKLTDTLNEHLSAKFGPITVKELHIGQGTATISLAR